MHPWAKFSPEEHARRRRALRGATIGVGALCAALFVLQMRVIFGTPSVAVENDPFQLGTDFFRSVRTDVQTVRTDVETVFAQLGEAMEREDRRRRSEQAIAEKLRARLETSDAAAASSAPQDDGNIGEHVEPFPSSSDRSTQPL